MTPEGNGTGPLTYKQFSEYMDNFRQELKEEYVNKQAWEVAYQAICERLKSLEGKFWWAITASIGLLLLLVGSVLSGHLSF